jgi:hypothetical protein
LHNSEEFLKQFELVKKELNATDVRSARAADNTDGDVYTLGGVRLPNEPEQKGVYIQGSKKVLY